MLIKVWLLLKIFVISFCCTGDCNNLRGRIETNNVAHFATLIKFAYRSRHIGSLYMQGISWLVHKNLLSDSGSDSEHEMACSYMLVTQNFEILSIKVVNSDQFWRGLVPLPGFLWILNFLSEFLFKYHTH